MKSYFENGVTVIDTQKRDNVKPPKSGHVGVYEHTIGRFEARFSKIYLGAYSTVEEAAAVRKEAERRHKDGTLEAWAEQFRRKNRLKK